MSSIRTVFLGSPEFALPSLEALLESPAIDVILVVTQPDRKAGRGRKMQPPPVKVFAEEHGIPVYQPESLRVAGAVERLRAESPDVLVVVSYGEILQKTVLELAPHGALNVHPSLLPRYRGAVPVQAAILNGDSQTGVSFIKLVRRMDAGPIVHQIRVPLTGVETAGELSSTLSTLAADHLPGVVLGWVKGDTGAIEQDEADAVYTRELRKADAQIDWTWSARYIERFVRAMSPWPRAWSVLGDQRLSVERVIVVDEQPGCDEPAGQISVVGDGVLVTTGAGILKIDMVQPAGKRTMNASDWARGLQNQDELSFANPDEDRPLIIFRRDITST